MHGDELSYPLAQVEIVVDGVAYILEVAVSASLPVSVLLGRDVPEIVSLSEAKHKAVGMHGDGFKEVMEVVTRKQASKKRTEETQLIEREKEEAVVTTPVTDPAGEDPVETPMVTDLAGEDPVETPMVTDPAGEDPVETPMAQNESAISSGPRPPRAAIQEPEQNWIEEGPGVAFDDGLFEEKSSIDAGLGVNISASELGRLQRVDSSLCHIWETITSQEDESLNWFMEQDGLLWQRGQDMVSKEECQKTAQKRHKPAFLFGCQFLLTTDHKLLLTLFGPNKPTPALAAN